jgi:hypothetical protein
VHFVADAQTLKRLLQVAHEPLTVPPTVSVRAGSLVLDWGVRGDRLYFHLRLGSGGVVFSRTSAHDRTVKLVMTVDLRSTAESAPLTVLATLRR